MARIISGRSRNSKVEMPPGKHTRPTGERVKEAVFSSLQMLIDGARFLDLYAGSGQMGLEAASRGAEVVMVESDAVAFRYLKQNVRRSGLAIETYRTRDQVAIGKLLEQGRSFDIIYCDPPWDDLENTILHHSVLEKLSDLLSEEGMMLLEARSKDTEVLVPGLNLDRRNQYGNTTIYFYRKQLS